jgi:hypothetical protein
MNDRCKKCGDELADSEEDLCATCEPDDDTMLY